MTTEHTPKTPSPRTGLFALLGGLLRATGTGASATNPTNQIHQGPTTAAGVFTRFNNLCSRHATAGKRARVGNHPAQLRSYSLTTLLTLIVLAFAATPAFAGKQYIAGPSFGEKGAAAGQLEDPEGIAVNNDASSPSLGDVYVADTGNRRIDVFTSSGTFVMAFGKNVGGLGEDTCTVTCVAGESGSEPGAFEAPRYIAVDQTTGDVYVEDTPGNVQANTGENVITKFSESGALIKSWGTEGQLDETTGGASFGVLLGVAVDPAGDLLVREAKSEGRDVHVAEFSDTGVFDETFPTQESLQPGLAVDSTGGVYVSGSNQVEKYESGSEVSAFGNRSGALAVNPATNNVLAFNSAFQLSEGNGVQLFPPFAPFRCVPDPGKGEWEESACLTKAASAGQGGFEREPSAPIEKFAEGLSESNGIAVSGAEAAGYPLYVTQPATDTVATYDYLQLPEVSSVPASSVEIKQEAGHATVVATLNGTVNPNELPVTSCEFEYGTTTAYGKIAPCAHPDAAELGSGAAAEPVSAVVSNLLPSTTYHFRIRAANQNDEREQPNPGLDEEFLTPGPSVVSEAPASEVKAATATLSGEVNPGGLSLSKCEFEYGTTAEFKATGLYQSSVPCAPDAAEVGAGTSPVPVHAALTGLVGSTAYSFRLVATTEVFATKEQVTLAGAGGEFTTLTTPLVARGEAVNLTAGGAELRATVNPEGLQVTHCAFEYGTSTAYEESEPCEPSLKQIGHGTQPVSVSATISELQPNTTYHWRLSVRDKNGEAFAVDHTFIYPTTATAELPDNRAYELVTPPFKNGALIGDAFGGFEYSISAGGSRVMAISIQCFDSEETCTGARNNQGEPFEFTRTSTGWVTTPLAPPQQLHENTAWRASADAGTALFSAPTGPGREDEWWARGADGAFAALGPVTPPGVSGIEHFKQLQNQSTADLSHVVWETEAFWPFDKTTGNASLYEYAGTANKEPFLVGVTGGEYNAGNSERNNELISTCGTGLGSVGNGTHESASGALSGDGRTVYFTAFAGHNDNSEQSPCPSGSGANEHTPVPVQELYARVDGEGSSAHTVAISEPRAPQAPGSDAPHPECESEECTKSTESPAPPATNPSWRDATFWGASTDGSKVFFTSSQQLTDDATEGTSSVECIEVRSTCNLYLYDFDQPSGHNLIDVSAGVGGAPVPGGPRVQGPEAISADGSHVYFVAKGVLTGLPNSQGLTPRDGADNLYVYDTETKHTAFIATLPGYLNLAEGESADWSTLLYANVTPDGRFLVFASHGDLTPDDTRTDGRQQIFRYDAENGELVRVSVGNEGFNDDGNGGTGNAAIVPAYDGGPITAHAGFPRADPTMSDDGAYVFFMSPVALTPHALNDFVIGEEIPTGSGFTTALPIYAQNVYEYHEGHVYLISDGHDTSVADSPCAVEEATHGSASCLLGSDASGHNVFFETTDQLVPKDTDTQVDIYDARICEPEHGNPCITEPPPALSPCGGENCHGIPPERSPLLTGGSETFNGKGNIAPALTPPAVVKKKTVKCKRGFTKNKKGRCIKKKKHAKAKKTNNRKGRA
jgi:hypothetical protein